MTVYEFLRQENLKQERRECEEELRELEVLRALRQIADKQDKAKATLQRTKWLKH